MPSSSSSHNRRISSRRRQMQNEVVINRIESLVTQMIKQLSEKIDPSLVFPSSQDDDENQTSINKTRASSVVKKNKQRCVHFSNISSSRHFTSLIMVLSFIHQLLLSERTTTTREVFYYFVTHFRNQKECDGIIFEICELLNGVDRIQLGITASPKGWFCGKVKITRRVWKKKNKKKRGYENNTITTTATKDDDTAETVLLTTDGTSCSSIQGYPITSEWLRDYPMLFLQGKDESEEEDDEESEQDSSSDSYLQITSDAKCIILIEKEGIYTRLSEDEFYVSNDCILITGRGFPDLATRAFVFTLHQYLQIPVYGVCDCNPFGFSVLQTYELGYDFLQSVVVSDESTSFTQATCDTLNYQQMNMQMQTTQERYRYGVPVQWLGLKPSQVMDIMNDDDEGDQDNNMVSSSSSSLKLPDSVFQKLTSIDYKRANKMIGQSLETEKNFQKRVIEHLLSNTDKESGSHHDNDEEERTTVMDECCQTDETQDDKQINDYSSTFVHDSHSNDKMRRSSMSSNNSSSTTSEDDDNESSSCLVNLCPATSTKIEEITKELQERHNELELMVENGYKVELESLHWLGMDYLTRWLSKEVAIRSDMPHDEDYKW